MRFQTHLAAALVLAVALPAQAQDGVHIDDPYARFMPGSKAGAAFLVIENDQMDDDRLIGASSPAAAKVELHTHRQTADGMMQMIHVTEGLVVPGNGTLVLERGGNHLMFMGLTELPAEGSTVPVTLVFERAGEVTVEVPVDNKREAGVMMGN